ncbi:MAG: CAP domain-containing protein [Flavobacterium sp.]|nr:CAP domain-containing protein [Flavobacterium sp.]
MKSLALKSLLVVAFVLSLTSCSSPSNEDNSSKPELIQQYAYSADEMELADLINEYRISKGLNALDVVNHVSFKSEEHNVYMIAKKAVNHDLFDQRSQNIMEVLGAVKVNENVAYNFATPASALNAWLNSPAHKANIEGAFTHFGISIRTDSLTGKKYYTNIFLKK